MLCVSIGQGFDSILPQSLEGLIEVKQGKVRQAKQHDWTEATDKQQSYQTSKPLYIVVGILFKRRDQQLQQVEEKTWKPPQKVENEDQCCSSGVIPYSRISHLTVPF